MLSRDRFLIRGRLSILTATALYLREDWIRTKLLRNGTATTTLVQHSTSPHLSTTQTTDSTQKNLHRRTRKQAGPPPIGVARHKTNTPCLKCSGVNLYLDVPAGLHLPCSRLWRAAHAAGLAALLTQPFLICFHRRAVGYSRPRLPHGVLIIIINCCCIPPYTPLTPLWPCQLPREDQRPPRPSHREELRLNCFLGRFG